ncbi:START domain-containing protein [Sinimarinibacterium sp. CAU 1509]|uniref:START domain-containing protein n=1 Tax=Sinimarinibacterium sp. CAU 1509 TaxID=2562283 RepID=UPI00146D2E3C|nr:START domain-containing protein [Sinimarinibacterium sp. CAU 1509]
MAAFLLSSFQAWGGASDVWRLDRNEDGIQVSSRLVEGSSVRAIRAEVDIKASFARTVALLLDASMRPRWDEICVEASVYAQVSDVEDLIYVHNALPWPVNDRDMVMRRTWAIAADGSSAQIRATAENGVLPKVAGRVRVDQADGVWTVVRTGESSVRVSTEIHVDPGGPVPAWLMNSLSVQGPYNALRNIRQLLESGDDSPGADQHARNRLQAMEGS